MRVVRSWLLIAMMILTGGAMLPCQVAESASGPYAPGQYIASYPSCPAFNNSLPSAAASRCDALSKTGDLMDSGNHLFAKIGGLGGYDSAFDGREGLDSSFKGGIIYAGLVSLKSKTYNLFENTASGVDYGTPVGTFQYLDSASVALTHVPSTRTIVSLDANNIFGNDAIRILDVNNATASVESPTYGIHAGRILDNQATLRLSRQSTETHWWSASIRNNFRDFLDDKSQANTVHGRAEFHVDRSERVGIGVFEETAVETGTVDCASQSLGLVYERRFTQAIDIEGAAGPAIGTKDCGSRYSANLYGAFSAQPARSTNLWVSAFRKLNDSQFSALTYENNAQGGWMQRFKPDTWLKIQGGWVGGTVARNTAPFHGEYVASNFGHGLAGGLTATLSVQYFNWEGLTNVAPTRTLFTAGLYWSPNRAEANKLRGPMAR